MHKIDKGAKEDFSYSVMANAAIDELEILRQAHAVDIPSQYPFIPYLVERKILKKITKFLVGVKAFSLLNERVVKIDSRWPVLIEGKVSRLNMTELYLFQIKLEEEGVEWGLNYLVGGLRRLEHLCPFEPKLSCDIRRDVFVKIDGVSLF